ncbi:MAG: hypothetical protein LBB46_05170 [Coriobacteriaceae bacterium]|nr:hypothetical protein [Coriobacteriaceae bacterium]
MTSTVGFEEFFEEYWIREGHLEVDVAGFQRLSDAVAEATAPLKPLLGIFAFTAYDPLHPWSDNSEQFFKAWFDLIRAHYAEGLSEAPLLFVGFHLKARFGSSRNSWGMFLTDCALYVSVSLYGDEPPRRYAYSAADQAQPGWAGAFASRVLADFDPDGIEQLVKLSNEPSNYDGLDNPAGINFASVTTPGQMAGVIRSEIILTLEALAGFRAGLGQPDAAETGPVPLTRRVMELGLAGHVRLGTDQHHAKHFKKLAEKLNMGEAEEIVFTLSDATFAGVYGLAVTNRAIRSRDLMESAVVQPLAPAEIFSNDKKRTLAIGKGPVHHIGETVPERLMPAVVTLLNEYLNGDIGE